MAKLVSFFIAVLISFWLAFGAPIPHPINSASQPLSTSGFATIINLQAGIPTATPSAKIRVEEFRTVMKDVGEAHIDHFGLTREDFERLKALGVSAVEGNFDVCASEEDVQFFLDESAQAHLGVILTAGAGEAEWGYNCEVEQFPSQQLPVWQSEVVVSWVNKWKSHPAVIAWDISNEAGTTFPNASPDHPERLVTVEQLSQAYSDIKTVDPTHPILIRMMGWYFYDYEEDFFRVGNPFDKDISDIVMVNAYSNVEEYFPDFVPTVLERAHTSIETVDPNVQLIVALGAWREEPLWKLPLKENLEREIQMLREQETLLGLAIFKYGAQGSSWYMPVDAPSLLPVIHP